MSDAPAVWPRPRHRPWVLKWPAILAGLGLFLLGIFGTWPRFPDSLDLVVTFPDFRPGQTEPLIVTGETENGDFLLVKYIDANHIAFVYDAWGAGGPSSDPVPCAPESTHHLTLRMPALVENVGYPDPLSRLRVAFDGRPVLTSDVGFHRRGAKAAYFGVNATGGSTTPAFRGTLQTTDGRVLRGGIETYFTPWRRVGALLSSPGKLARVLGGALSGALLVGLAFGLMARCFDLAPDERRRARRANLGFGIAASVATIVFAYFATAGDFTLTHPDWFGSFYDYQAAGLLQGRLDVPEQALGGEAFLYGGKCYGYFGPTPALLRIPLALLDVGFAERTRVFLILEYAFALAGAYAVLRQLAATTRLRIPPAGLTAMYTVAIGLGSTLLFLSSRQYVYHEAILCGAAFALWSSACVLGYLREPGSRWWIGALLCGLLSIHARPPVGLFALAFLGFAAAAHLLPRVIRHSAPAKAKRVPNDAAAGPTSARGDRPTRHLVVGALAVLGVLSFNGLSYLKFHTIDGCPLRYNVQYNPERLAHIDGKQFHLGNVRFGFAAYIWKPTLAVAREFPFFASASPSWRDYPKAKMDLVEPTTGLPYAMPGLCALALLAMFAAFATRGPFRQVVIVTVIAFSVPALAMFAAIAVSHRYTGDFVPALCVLAAAGMARVDQLRKQTRAVLASMILVAVIASVIINVGLTMRYQAEGFGEPPGTIQRYKRWRAAIAQVMHDGGQP